jgi:hypothetical protein
MEVDIAELKTPEYFGEGTVSENSSGLKFQLHLHLLAFSLGN